MKLKIPDFQTSSSRPKICYGIHSLKTLIPELDILVVVSPVLELVVGWLGSTEGG
jgi:hypothetical protein